MTVSIKEFLPSEDHLQASDFKVFFEKMPELTFRKRDKLFDESNASLYLMLSGTVKVGSWYGGKELAEDYFQTGELINCGILLGNTQRQFAEAMTRKVTVKKMPAFLAREIARSNDAFQEQVLSSIYESLNRSRQRVYRVSLLKAEDKVIHFLINYVKRSGRKVGFEYVIKPVMTHEEMSLFTGASRQTVSTVFSRLRREGIIHFTRRYLIIRELKKLKNLL